MQKIRELMRTRKRLLLPLLLLLLLIPAAGIAVLKGDDDNGKGKPGADVLGNAFEGDQALGLQLSRRPVWPDSTAPSVSWTFPKSNGIYNADAWGNGCEPDGICGSASDPSGMEKVEVAIRQQGGNYWSGSAFDSPTPTFLLASGTTSWNLTLARPVDGTYVVSVRATDLMQNALADNKLPMVTFRVDTVAPPTPSFVRFPEDVTFDQHAGFRFDNTEGGVKYRCQLDDGPETACGKDIDYQNLSTTDHRLRVWAVDAAGNQSPPAEFFWTVLLRREFGIDGNAIGSASDGDSGLKPGSSMALDSEIQNPFKFPFRVVEMSVMATGTAACPADVHLEAIASTFTVPVIIPANSRASLSDLGIPKAQWPQLRMKNLPVNQDGCKGVTFKLTYEGTGTKS